MKSDEEQLDPGLAAVVDIANALNDAQIEQFVEMTLVQVDHA